MIKWKLKARRLHDTTPPHRGQGLLSVVRVLVSAIVLGGPERPWLWLGFEVPGRVEVEVKVTVGALGPGT